MYHKYDDLCLYTIQGRSILNLNVGHVSYYTKWAIAGHPPWMDEIMMACDHAAKKKRMDSDNFS